VIITDTGFWFALFNKHDSHHQRATQLLSELTEPMITTWPVMTETCHLLLKRQGIQAQLNFINSYKQNGFMVFNLDTVHRTRVQALMLEYADLPMDLADASLVILAETLQDGRILSTDKRDFNTYRWKNHYPFENLFV